MSFHVYQTHQIAKQNQKKEKLAKQYNLENI